jgi:hypothetical protein
VGEKHDVFSTNRSHIKYLNILTLPKGFDEQLDHYTGIIGYVGLKV